MVFLIFSIFSDCTPASIFASKAEHQVDIQRKLQEDPLIALKQTEVDKRKRLLDNPMKMKQVQDYVSLNSKRKRNLKIQTISRNFLLFFYRFKK